MLWCTVLLYVRVRRSGACLWEGGEDGEGKWEDQIIVLINGGGIKNKKYHKNSIQKNKK